VGFFKPSWSWTSRRIASGRDGKSFCLSLSRRDAAALIVGAAAGVGTFAGSAHADIADPIFGLIAAHGHAYAEYDAAATAADAPCTQEQLDWPGVYLCHSEPASFVLNGKRHDVPSMPVYLHSLEEIDEWPEKEIRYRPASEVMKIEARRLTLKVEYAVEVKRLGLYDTPLDATVHAAGAVESNAIRAVLRTEARTVNGLLAQIRYVSKYMREFQLPDLGPGDDDLVPALLDVLANALDKILL
jgi:hypothetical protein